MNAELREKEHWTQPGESQPQNMGHSLSEIAETNDGPVNVTLFLLRSLERGGRWLWRIVEENRSAVRTEWSEENTREENLRELRAELRKVMFMKI